MHGMRPAVRHDAWAVARVHEMARAAYYGVDPPAERDPERVAMWWSAIGDHNRATVLVVEDGDDVVGFVSFGPPIHEVPLAGPVLELHALYVLPGRWGCGVGSRLHASFVERLEGGRTGVLDVWERNTHAIGFYERRGWCRDGRSRPGEDGTAYVGMSIQRCQRDRRSEGLKSGSDPHFPDLSDRWRPSGPS